MKQDDRNGNGGGAHAGIDFQRVALQGDLQQPRPAQAENGGENIGKHPGAQRGEQARRKTKMRDKQQEQQDDAVKQGIEPAHPARNTSPVLNSARTAPSASTALMAA